MGAAKNKLCNLKRIWKYWKELKYDDDFHAVQLLLTLLLRFTILTVTVHFSDEKQEKNFAQSEQDTKPRMHTSCIELFAALFCVAFIQTFGLNGKQEPARKASETPSWQVWLEKLCCWPALVLEFGMPAQARKKPAICTGAKKASTASKATLECFFLRIWPQKIVQFNIALSTIMFTMKENARQVSSRFRTHLELKQISTKKDKSDSPSKELEGGASSGFRRLTGQDSVPPNATDASHREKQRRNSTEKVDNRTGWESVLKILHTNNSGKGQQFASKCSHKYMCISSKMFGPWKHVQLQISSEKEIENINNRETTRMTVFPQVIKYGQRLTHVLASAWVKRVLNVNTCLIS